MSKNRNPVQVPRLKRARAVSQVCHGGLENLSGIRDVKSKCRWGSLPGHSKDFRRKISDFGMQHLTKQAVRGVYGGLSEKQFRNLFNKADRMKGSTDVNLMVLLETRLDNVVYRSGFASTRREAKQMISHGHIEVNQQRVTVGSYHVSAGDVITVKERCKSHLRVRAAIDLAQQRGETEWLDVDFSQCVSVVKQLPEADQLPQQFKVNLIIELYSK